MKYLCKTILIFILVSFIFGGCSANNSGNSLPVYSSLDNTPPIFSGVTEYNENGSPIAGNGAMGIYGLHLDKIELSAELTPLRNIALTDVLEIVDISNFLQMAPCSDCALIDSVTLDGDGNLVVSIGIKHPFGAGDPFKPITGQNRADLHVFNIEGTVISGDYLETFSLLGESVSDIKLISADGYSAYLDESLDDFYPTDSSIHPYVLHFDDYSSGNFDALNPTGFETVTDPPPSGNLVMAMGSDYDYQDYIFALQDGSFDFLYAIGCTYAVSSAAKVQRFNPEYRVPQHNKKAASEVEFVIISNDLAGGDTLSTADIEIHVVDISHGVPVGETLDEMYADSSVDDIFIDLPGVMNNLLILDGNNPQSGTGHDPSDPLVYAGTISNETGAAEGIYTGLIKVTDSYLPGQNQSPLLGGSDGIKRTDPLVNPLAGTFQIDEFATYQVFEISVALGNDIPIAILLSDPDPAIIEQLDMVDFDASTSYDPDGTITLYEFDYDWDGVEANFVADESNVTGLWQDVQFVDIGDITVGLRVTDDLLEEAYDSVVVSVTEITDVIYVDDSNTSGTEDGTQANPYNTIMEGLNAATPGFQIWVDDSGNDYDEYIYINSISDIQLSSINWDSSDGTSQASIYQGSGYIVYINNSSSIIVDGFKIHGSSNYGIRMYNAFESEIRNCWITEIGINNSNGITVFSVSNSNGSVIEDCEISNCEANVVGGFCNVLSINTSAMRIQGNEIHDIRKPLGSGFINCSYYSSCVPASGYNLEILQNEIYDLKMAGSGFINCMYMSQCDDVDIKNNLIYDIAKESGGANIGIYCSGLINSEIHNNTMYDFESDTFNMGIYVNDGSPNSIDSRNNIFQYFHRTNFNANGWAVYFNDPPTITWNYNNIYDVSYLTVPTGTGNLNVDSVFVDPANYDLHLDTGSPCIDTGDPAISDPDSSRSDMGCYGGPGGSW